MHKAGDKVFLKRGVYKNLDDPFMDFHVEVSNICAVVILEVCANEIIADASKKDNNPVRISVSHDKIVA